MEIAAKLRDMGVGREPVMQRAPDVTMSSGTEKRGADGAEVSKGKKPAAQASMQQFLLQLYEAW